MSASNDDIRVRIAGDLRDINVALQDLKRRTRDAGKEAASSSRDWGKLGTGLDSLKRQVLGRATKRVKVPAVRAVPRGDSQLSVTTASNP